jgi:hypothetical protein
LPVSASQAINVLNGVVDYLMLKFIRALVGLQRIAVQPGASSNSYYRTWYESILPNASE